MNEVLSAVTKYVDVVTLAAIQNLGLRAKLVVEGLFAGIHRSPFKGFSVEFSEYRPYQPGDEPRLIDWRAFGRADRFYVKTFDEETNVRCYLCVDVSGSMAYPPGRFTKYDYAATLAASLAFLALRQRDAAGLVTFADGLRSVVPPRSSKQHYRVILEELTKAALSGPTNIAASVAALAERVNRRGLFIFFSDFWDSPERIVTTLRALRGAKHEVVAFHILDEAEEDFPFGDAEIFEDMETGGAIYADARSIRSAYLDSLARFKRELGLALGAYGVSYVPVVTSAAPSEVLVSYLGKRKALM